MTELPLAPFKRIMKNEGANRVSEEATEALRDEVEEFAGERARQSKDLAEHAGRSTVHANDVRKSQ